jgi:hypothetical protein
LKHADALLRSATYVYFLSEKGRTYREITKEAGVSPNTIKSVLNRAGLNETTSISSRAFELFSEGKTPLQVAIALNLEAEKAIQYHQEYYMLLGCTEFTKIYLQIKDNPWPFVNLFKLVQNSGMSGGEVVELLKIANEHLPRVRLEYDRVKAELNSKKAELSNTVQIYQQFVDRNIALKNREDELLLNIGELEARESELQKTTTELQRHISELQHEDNNNLNLEITQEDFSSNDVLIPSSNKEVNYHQNENETPHYPTQMGPSSRTLIFDTGDLFHESSSLQSQE